MNRAYVGTNTAALREWYEAGLIPAGVHAYCVSADMRQEHPDADDEELEYFATVQAHAAALDGGGRAAVIALDAPLPAGVTTSPTVLSQPVEVGQWAAVFLDDLEWFDLSEITYVT